MATVHGECQRCHKKRGLIQCRKFGRHRRLCARCKAELERMTGGYDAHGMGSTKNPTVEK